MTGQDYGLLDLIQSGGVVGILVFIVIALLRGWVFTRNAYMDVVRERDGWRAIALHGMKVSEKAVDALKGPR